MKLTNLIGHAVPYLLMMSLPALAQTTTRVSVDSFGGQATGKSGTASVSADGRYVAFDSFASDLVPLDINGVADIFVRDTFTGVTTLVSVTSAGAQAQGGSFDPAISADGRFVAFQSIAANFPGANGWWQIYVHDRVTGATTLASVSSLGATGNSDSPWASLSEDGQRVAFSSSANNLVPNDTNGLPDVFVRDLAAGTTTRVSVLSNGAQALGGASGNWFCAVISGDGEHVAFSSQADNLVPGGNPNAHWHIYVHDLPTGVTTLVSVSSEGELGQNTSGYPSLSRDGRCVSFNSWASNLVPMDYNGMADVFVHDRDTDGDGILDEPGAIGTELVSVHSDGTQGDKHSAMALARGPALSADANVVAFFSLATNLVDGDTNDKWDVFVHNRTTRETARVSLSTAGAQGDEWSRHPSLSADGQFVAFESNATNLVAGDTNGDVDAFLRDQGAAPPIVYCTAGMTSNGCSATISSAGVPSASAPSGFTLTASGGEGNKSGLFFFGTTGRQAKPWGTGASYQCVVPPVKRTGLLLGSGINGSCDGSYSRDLNQVWFNTPAKNPGAGAVVQAQLWFRDPQNTSSQPTSLSDALEFGVLP